LASAERNAPPESDDDKKHADTQAENNKKFDTTPLATSPSFTGR
jgi:hypothetical protein